MKTVALVGTFDSKGHEYAYLKELLEAQGLNTLTINAGVFESVFAADVENGEVAAAAGVDVADVIAKGDRAYATETMAKGLAKLVPQLYSEGRFNGILALGGSGGTALASAAMQPLPIGVPKLIVSTMASGDTARYVGTSDIIMMPSVVDVAGLNSISTKIFANAAFAMAGMMNYETDKELAKKPLIAATMFGVTTPAVTMAKEYLEDQGYEVLVFHATGSGGDSMEALIDGGFIEGVLDLTTTEFADKQMGGILRAGPRRLKGAGEAGIPQVVSVGALDMVNFGEWDSVPSQYKERNLYKHNPTITLMRTTVDENRGLGEEIAGLLNAAKGPTAMLLPLKGVSMIDAPGEAFYGPDEDEMLFSTLREKLNPEAVELIEYDNHVNDREFAEAAAKKLIELMGK